MRNGNLRFSAWHVPALIAFVALLLPGAAAAATTGSIAGTVTDASGGLGGIEVCADGVGAATQNVEECGESGTPSGVYKIANLPPGPYVVEFWPQGANYVRQYWHGVIEISAATVVTVGESASITGIDAELKEGSTISGRVTAAATGKPVANVEACAHKSGFTECGLTNAGGEYDVVGLPTGAFEMFFYPEDEGQELVSQTYASTVNITMPGSASTVDVALEKGGQIGGTVRLAATGASLAGVRVCLLEAREVYTLGCLKTPASGRYLFTGLEEISYKIVFSPESSELIGPDTGSEQITELTEAPDAYSTVWWNGKTSFGTATPVAIAPPAAVTGIDAVLGPPPVVIAPSTSVAPAPIVAAPKPTPVLICHKGFAKRKVKGKQRCVKVHKKHKRHHKKHRARRPA